MRRSPLQIRARNSRRDPRKRGVIEAMAPKPHVKAQVIPQDYEQWVNVHQTVKQRVTRFYDIGNPPESARGSRIQKLRATISAIQGLIRQASRDGIPLRALGSSWSFSKVAATDGVMLNTAYLNWIFGMSATSISSTYQGERTSLVFAQCGAAIGELNTYLAKKGRSLKTSGASNGQTIARALSTGTHGSAFGVGAIQDFIVGLHLIVGPSRHLWLERASYPVMQPSFAQKLGAELIRDDTLFNAALVSFGSFGIIHAVMLETEPIFLLEAHRQRLPFDSLMRRAITTLDFTGLGLPHPNERPYHFEIQVNPHNLEKGVFVRTMYKRPFTSDHQNNDDNEIDVETRPGDDFAAFLGAITDTIPDLTPILVNTLTEQRLNLFSNKVKTLGEMFDYSKTRGKVIGMAMGLPLSQVTTVLDRILDVHKTDGPYPGVIELRFVKGSDALLAFTRFDPTCVMELDGVNSSLAKTFFKRVLQALDQNEIPYTLHWGKVNDHLTATRVRRMYGENLDQWLSSRRTLLSQTNRAVFSNAFLNRLDLAT